MNRSQRLPRGYLVPPTFQSRQDKVRSIWIVKEQSEDKRTGGSSTSEAVVSCSSKEIVTSNSGSRLMESDELTPAHERQSKVSIRSSGYGRARGRDYRSSLSECSSISACSSTATMGGGCHASSTRTFVPSRSRWPCDVLAGEGSCHQLDVSPILKKSETFSGGRMYPNYEKKVKDTENYRLQHNNLKSRWNDEVGPGSRFAGRTRGWGSGFSYDQRSNTALKLEKQRRMSWNRSSHILRDADPEPLSCPICMEMLDETDSSFSSCSCGFKLCLFCHHTIATDDGRCPGCRKSYDQKVI